MIAQTYRTAEAINSAMLGVYRNMFVAVAVSMLTALIVSASPALMAFLFTGMMKWVTIFAPLAALLVMSFAQQNFNTGQLRLFLWAFAALMGLSMSTIFIVYTVGSIVSAFMGASVLFGTMSFYGYFTKKNLESWGSFLLVGLIAVVIASVINVFIGSGVGAMVISAIAIIVFLGLTAYDTQRIRELVQWEGHDGRGEVLGALSLYLNFINIFMSLLQLFGNRND
jgi:FtsH-binding integral membrane protein